MKPINKKRRDFLAGLAKAAGVAGFAPFSDVFLSALFRGWISQAHAANFSGGTAKTYIYFNMQSAPSRWTFDLILNPLNQSIMSSGKQVITKMLSSGGRYLSGEYKTFAFTNSVGQTIHLPYLWSLDVPRAGGGTRPMTELAEHFLTIRGMDTRAADHKSSSYQQQQFTTGLATNGSFAADQSKAILPAVHLGGYYPFESTKNLSLATFGINSSSKFSPIFSAFSNANFMAHVPTQKEIKNQVLRALASIDSDLSTEVPKSEVMKKDFENATELFNKSFGNLNKRWDQLFGKYDKLIKAVMTTAIPGISDKPIGVVETESVKRTKIHNSQTMFGVKMVKNPDMRSMIDQNTSVRNLAEHFAVAEFLIAEGLSDSIAIVPRGLTGVLINGQRHEMNLDEHASGALTSLLVNSYLFRAYAACLLEFIDFLKSKNRWNSTLIHVGAEFNRSARDDGSGSDHGWPGTSATLLCGSIHGTYVLGDIYDRSPTTQYPGIFDFSSHTWGYGANGFTTGELGATLAKIFGAPNPVAFTQGLVKIKSGRIIPDIALGRILRRGK